MNARARHQNRRRGITLPLVAVCMVGICGFVALAIDVGRVAVAKVECQAAADVAAMAGVRTLSGILPQDTTAATTAAQNAATSLQVMGQSITASNVTVTHGTYHYNTTAQDFVPSFTLQAGENYNLTQATVTFNCPTTFASLLGKSAFSVSTTAIAAHRPRDVTIILDYSGSMNNESDLWNCESYLDNGQSAPNNTNYSSNNSETIYPLFGHYAGSTTAVTPTASTANNYNNYTNYPNLLSPAAGSGNPLTGSTAIGKSNNSISALGIPPMVNDYWSNARGGTATAGFTQIADSTLDTYNQPYNSSNAQVGGDRFLRKSNNNLSQPYATTLADVTGSTSKNSAWESSATGGYESLTGHDLYSYTQGPRYWGKTFFIWPPDPTFDWRQFYFGNGTGIATAGANAYDNTNLWDAGGNFLDPPGNYTINYKAILNFIKNVGPNPFPASLRSGNTIFYSSIPTDVPAASYDHTVANSTITNSDQRFWKEYIDYALGVWRDPNGNIQHPNTPTCSYGPDYTFGTVQISSPPLATTGQYMNYKDNPQRPRHRFWFGPMTMIQYMSDTGINPGTVHDISLYPMKTGIGGALQDIQNNHPNDLVSMIIFDRPQYSNDAAGTGAFNVAQYSMTNNYQAIINALWVPPNSGSTDATPWDPNGTQTPRAHGDYDSNTASSYGFMLAYNQFSSSPTLRALEQSTTPGVGGLGRVTAQRLVIYETDGMANEDSIPTGGLVNVGAPNSYYAILPGQTVNGGGFNQTALLQVVQNICNNADGSPTATAGYAPFTPNLGYPGYSIPGKPVSVQCVVFGAIFEIPGANQNSSVSLVQQISQIGGSTFPSSPTDPTNGFKWCVGTITQRETKLRQAFTNIMNSGIPITLVK